MASPEDAAALAQRAGIGLSAAVRENALGALAAVMLAVFAATAGSSVLVPVLPFYLERTPSAGGLSAEWHVSLLTSLYMFAAFVFAPLWGRWSDRFGRRAILLVGLAGQSATAMLLGLEMSLGYLYGVRMLNGLFAASVFPVAQACAADRDDASRARWFSWVGTAALLGFLAGPLLGGALSGTGPPALLQISPLSPWLAAPALAAALLAAVALVPTVAVARLDMRAIASETAPATAIVPATRFWTCALPWIGFVVMLAVGVFELAITLQAKTLLSLSAFDIGLLFAECSVVMIAAQFLAFSRFLRNAPRERVLAMGTLTMAAGVAMMPFTGTVAGLMLWIAIFSGSAGLLLPLAAYWLSSATSAAQGRSMGKLYAYSNLGQATGSVVAGPLFAVIAFAPFIAAAAVLGATTAVVKLRSRP